METSGSIQVNGVAVEGFQLDDGHYMIFFHNGAEPDGLQITYQSAPDPSFDVYSQILDADGNPTGYPQVVNNTTYQTQAYPNVLALADGSYVVVWSQSQNDVNFATCYQRFTSEGNKISQERNVSTSSEPADTIGLTALADGGFEIYVGNSLENFSIEASPPNTTINSVRYKDSVTNQVDDPADGPSGTDLVATIDGPGIIEINGTGFNEIASNQTDIKEYLDWSKFVWDIDGVGTAGVTFTLGDSNVSPTILSDIASVIVVSGTKIVVTLSEEGTAKLEGADGFARDGLSSSNVSDLVVITAGFTQDVVGNPSTTDAASLSPTYNSTVAPNIESFTSTTMDGSYGLGDDINITLTTSKTILGGSAVTVTLGTGDKVILSAAENGMTLSGTYTVPAGKTSSDLTISGVEATSGQSVVGLYNVMMTNFSVPSGKSLSDNTDIMIDSAGPNTTINSVRYKDSVTNQVDDPADGPSGTDLVATIDGPGIIEINGTGFNEIASNQTDIKEYLDWSKFVWDIDGVGTAGVTFTLGDSNVSPTILSDIASVIVVSGTKIVVTLSEEGTAKLEGADGFARDGLSSSNVSDLVVITAGFTQDVVGNPSTTDAASLSPTYNSTVAPNIESFTSTTMDGSYGLGDDINITLTTSKTILGGSAVTVTLGTGDKVILSAAENGMTLSGTYTVPAGKTSSDLTISGVEATSGQSVVGLYNVMMTNFSVPSGKSLSDNTDIMIDSAGPNTTINSVRYKDSVTNQVDDPADGPSGTDLVATIDGPGIIEINGTGFNEIASNQTDIKEYLDWSKFVWDIDGVGTAGVTFTLGDSNVSPTVLSDIASVIVVSGTKIVVTLSEEGTAKLEGADGFARDGLSSSNVSDLVVITAGFTQDVVGNPSTTDAASLSPTYNSTVAPNIESFTSTTMDGSYKVGDVINITATLSKDVLQGSSMTVSLDTGDKVELIADSTGIKLTGTYWPSLGDTTTNLTIASVAATSGKAVTTLFGQNMTAFEVPNGQNLFDNNDITIDTAVPETTISSVKYKDSVTNQVDHDSNAGTPTVDGPGIIEITGDGFEDIGADGTDVKAQLDWTKFVWDIDGAGTAGVTFTLGDAGANPAVPSDITSAIVGSGGTKIIVTLTDAATTALEGATGFARDGLTSTNVSDQIDITAGFTKDAAGNPSATDAASNLAPTYYDTASADDF